MGGRRRGQDTKEKVLEAACKVFADKGYRDATHAEICRLAGTNIASINYYFDSKETLYRAVFEHLAEKADSLYPLDGGLPADSDPEQRLRSFIRGHLSRMFDPERLGYLHRIRMAEMFDPTGLLTETLERRLAQDREHVQRVLRDLLGSQARQRDVEWCEMSIVGQCFMSAPGPGDSKRHKVFGFTAIDVDHLAEHITAFSLAGIKAVRQGIQERTELSDAGLQ